MSRPTASINGASPGTAAGPRGWRHPLIWIVLAFSGAVLLVNPCRETAAADDWAYALTVRHLLDTGEYRLHDWLSANMPFQAWWGAACCRLFGYSFTTLRFSTLTLALLGLLAFYGLAREQRLSRTAAGVLTLTLLGSPLALCYSFTFMTTVPFLSTLLAALWLYARAFERRSGWAMALASVPAAAAVLTRQFGVALLGGLAALWLMDAARWRRLPFYALGAGLPAAGALWQLFSGSLSPSWAQQMNMRRQIAFLADWPQAVTETLWRPAAVLHYLGLSAFPLVLLVAVCAMRRTPDDKSGARAPAGTGRAPLLLAAYLLTAWLCRRGWYGRQWWMPYLPFKLVGLRETWLCIPLTLATGTGAVLLGAAYADRLGRGWSKLSPGERLVDAVTVLLVIMHLVVYALADEYVTAFVPAVLLAVGRRYAGCLERHGRMVTGVSLAVLLAAALWTRGWLAEEEALWKGAEALRSEGAEPAAVFTMWTWRAYHTFDDYLEDIGRRNTWGFGDFFGRWEQRQRAEARYEVTLSSRPPDGRANWVLLRRLPYRDGFFRRRFACVWERRP